MIYLVLNVKGETVVLDICSSLEVANELADIYTSNFKNNTGDKCNFIIVEPVDTNTDSDVFWTLYQDDKEDKFAYNYQMSNE